MKIKTILPLALLSLTGMSSAATIIWGSATTIAGVSDVSTEGIGKQALNFGQASTASPTVNTVAFTGVNMGTLPASPVTYGSGEGAVRFTFTTAVRGHTYPSSPTVDTNYNSMLTQTAYASAAPGSFDLQLQGLTNGQQYQVQFWVHDGRGFGAGISRSTIFTTGANSVSLLHGVNSSNPLLGQWVTGTFTAGGTTQDIAVSASSVGTSDSGQINGYQLRAVPEPSSTALLGLGGLALILRRRK